MRCLWKILGITLWNLVQNTDDILERTGMVPVEELFQAETPPMVWPCLEDTYQPSPKTAAQVQAQWQE